MKRAREARQRRKKRSPRQQATIDIIRGVLLALLVFLGGLLILIFGTIVAILIQAGTFNGVSSTVLIAVSFPDWRLFVSEGLVDATIGVAIGYVLWRKLGEKKQNAIVESETMKKHYHLRLTERDNKSFVIDLKTKEGHPIPFYLQGIADEDMIQQATDAEVKDVKVWNKEVPSPELIGL